MSLGPRLAAALAEHDRQCLRRASGARMLPTPAAADALEDAIAAVAHEQGRTATAVRIDLARLRSAGASRVEAVEHLVGGGVA